MADAYQAFADGWHKPYANSFAITPNDTTPLAEITRAVYVGGAGNIVVKLENDSTAVTLTAVPVGALLEIRASLIMATGTTATNLIGLY